ncbi:MAG: DUF58 domain-containing protein [Gammaproteobacteria bacterium]|nr:DUF58 domain-containing protein [Gammaproteobacteria bacterium]
MSDTAIDFNDAVRVSVPGLVALNRSAAGLSLRTREVRAHISGEYLSRFKGRGMEFAESRPYQPGDDVRDLHWRVMARTGKPFTKLFREERERPVFVWVDLRQRMFFGTRNAYKSVVAARAAALIAWAASRHGDRIGGVLFSDGSHEEIKPGRGKAAVLYLIRRLVEHPAWEHQAAPAHDEHSTREAMIRLRRVVRPGSLVFLLSDFANFDAGAEANMTQIARRSEVLSMLIYDQLERELPPPGSYRLSDGEDEFVLDAADAEYRALYAERFAARIAHVGALARRSGMSFLTCRTDEDPLRVLQQGLGGPRQR